MSIFSFVKQNAIFNMKNLCGHDDVKSATRAGTSNQSRIKGLQTNWPNLKISTL
jgi:hypothetical protein